MKRNTFGILTRVPEYVFNGGFYRKRVGFCVPQRGRMRVKKPQNSERMREMGLILVNPDKCVGCNACIRSCPAPEANHTSINPETGKSVTVVNADKCIACGECIRVCQHGARNYDDDLSEYMKALQDRDKTIMIVTPSFKTAFPNTWRRILDWFRTQGVIAIYDVSFGADICSWAHLQYMIEASKANKEVRLITQPCAAIVSYCKKYRPELIEKLSPVHSPIGCEVVYLKTVLKNKYPIAALTPCIAKKAEFEETEHVQYNITFKKLGEYFEKNKIVFSPEDFAFQYDFDGEQGMLGAIYPRPGGLRDNLWFKDPDMNITTSEGVHKVYPELDMYAKMTDAKRPEIFDVLSCEFGCNTGPASGDYNSIFDIMATMRDIERDSKQLRGTSRGIFGSDRDKQYKYFDQNLNYKSYLRVYEAPRQKSYVPKDSELESVYIAMGKVNSEDRRYNCHACGYKSCRDMATAIYRGLNVPDNCIVFAKSALSKRYKEVEKISESVGQFANKLTADIENIYASLLAIDDKNKQGKQYVTTVNAILQSIIDTCNSTDNFNADDISALADTLQKLKGALDIMKNSSDDTTTNSSAIREAMEEVANSTMELSRMVEELVNSFEAKY